MLKKIAGAMVLVALMSGTAMADLVTPTRSSIDPNTPPPLGPQVPLIVGTVVTLDERAVVLDTHDGNTVTFMVDSRTMMPANMAAGQPMKVQYKVLDNGTYMAQRFTPVYGEAGRELAARHFEIYSTTGDENYAYGDRDGEYRSGTYDDDAARRDGEWARGTDRDGTYGSNDGAYDRDRTEAGGEVGNVTEDNDDALAYQDDASRTGDAYGSANDDLDRLPQTAGTGTWMAVLSVLSLAAAGGLSFARRRRKI